MNRKVFLSFNISSMKNYPPSFILSIILLSTIVFCGRKEKQRSEGKEEEAKVHQVSQRNVDPSAIQLPENLKIEVVRQG